MINDPNKATKFYERRNFLLKKILAITNAQLKAVLEDHIGEFINKTNERERYFEEFLAIEDDVRRTIEPHIRESSSAIAELNAQAKVMLEKAISIEPEIRKELQLRAGDIEKELQSLRKGRELLSAYSMSPNTGPGQKISSRG